MNTVSPSAAVAPSPTRLSATRDVERIIISTLAKRRIDLSSWTETGPQCPKAHRPSPILDVVPPRGTRRHGESGRIFRDLVSFIIGRHFVSDTRLYER